MLDQLEGSVRRIHQKDKLWPELTKGLYLYTNWSHALKIYIARQPYIDLKGQL